jgi:DNA-binding transcriptional MerR regulator
MNAPNEFFTISRICRLTGLAPETLERVQETLGDHLHVQRTPAGNRLFSAADLDCLQQVRRLLDDEGLSLEQVRDTLFPDAGPADPVARPLHDGDAAGVDGPDPVEARAPEGAASDDGPHVPDLPVAPTVDLLLEAAEGLVQENLKLRKAVDSLGERCLRLEQRLDRQGSAGILQRLFGRG